MQTLVFEKKRFDLIEIDGQNWLKAADLASALGFAQENAVSKIFNRHQDEFSASMTKIITIPKMGIPNQFNTVRVFSFRGAHLVAMFARTQVGIRFRRWVLNVLDEQERQKRENRSLLARYFEAEAKLQSQKEFASFCGRGLNAHKKRKPELEGVCRNLMEKMEPQLNLVSA